MNKEEKNKTLFSSGGIFVDIFIGFLIAASIAGVVYRCFIYDPHANEKAGESYMVYFEIQNAQPGYADYLEDGDSVYDGASGLRVGALAVYSGSPDGAAVLTSGEKSDGLTVTGVFRSRAGEMEEGSLVLDGTYRLTPGQVLELYTDTVAVTVRILKITDQAHLTIPEEQSTELEQTETDSEAESETVPETESVETE